MESKIHLYFVHTEQAESIVEPAANLRRKYKGVHLGVNKQPFYIGHHIACGKHHTGTMTGYRTRTVRVAPHSNVRSYGFKTRSFDLVTRP